MCQVESEKISGLIITHNEEDNIDEVISCLQFVDEIIVVDSNSTDNTLNFLRKYPKVKIIQNKFIDFTSQRNVALTYATNNWILFLDADERITPSLKDEIIAELKKTTTHDAYFFLRKFYFKKKPIHFSGTQNDKNYRLFKKDKAHYVNHKLVHETLEVEGTVGVFKNKLVHYSFDNYISFKTKMIHYASLKGKELYNQGVSYSFVLQYLKTAFTFFKFYFLRLGILDGWNGVVICYLKSLYVYRTYTQLEKQYIDAKKNIINKF